MDSANEKEVERSSLGTTALFGAEDALAPAPPVLESLRAKIASKVFEYGGTVREREQYTDDLVDALTGGKRRKKKKKEAEDEGPKDRVVVSYDGRSGALVEAKSGSDVPLPGNQLTTTTTTRRKKPVVPEPMWHAPWKLAAVVSGHLGWVRCCAFEPKNEWFATGSAQCRNQA